MYVCIYIYIYTYRIYIYTYMYMCVVRKCVLLLGRSMQAHTCMYAFIHSFLCMDITVLVRICMHVWAKTILCMYGNLKNHTV